MPVLTSPRVLQHQSAGCVTDAACSTQTDKSQDEQDDDDHTNQIDDPVHVVSGMSSDHLTVECAAFIRADFWTWVTTWISPAHSFSWSQDTETLRRQSGRRAELDRVDIRAFDQPVQGAGHLGALWSGRAARGRRGLGRVGFRLHSAMSMHHAPDEVAGGIVEKSVSVSRCTEAKNDSLRKKQEDHQGKDDWTR